MIRVTRLRALGADNEPMRVRLYVQPVGDHGTAMIAGGDVEPPTPGESKRIGFFGDTPGEAQALVLRNLGRCAEQNAGRAAVATDGTERSDP